MTNRRVFETQFVGLDRNAVATLRNVRTEASRLNAQQQQGTRTTTAASRASSILNNSLLRQAALLGGVTFGLYGAVNAMKSAISAASNLEEAQNAVNVIFGESATVINDFAQTTADSAGLSERATLQASAAFGNMFNTIGVARPAAANMSTTMVQLAADMASFNNEDPSAMLLRLRSGLAGEAEPLRRFGVLLSAARVEEAALRLGINDGTHALTEQEKVLARYSIIIEDTAVQQGDFERTSDSLANQTRTLASKWEELNATLGEFVTPIASGVVGALAEITGAANTSAGAIAGLAGRVGDFFETPVAPGVTLGQAMFPGMRLGAQEPIPGAMRFPFEPPTSLPPGTGGAAADVFAGAWPTGLTPEGMARIRALTAQREATLAESDFAQFLADQFPVEATEEVEEQIRGFGAALAEATREAGSTSQWLEILGTNFVPPLTGHLLELTEAVRLATDRVNGFLLSQSGNIAALQDPNDPFHVKIYNLNPDGTVSIVETSAPAGSGPALTE